MGHCWDSLKAETPADRAAIRIQHLYRQFRTKGIKLHRHNFSERLQFEWHVVCGAFRLLCQILLFGLLIAALQLSPTSTMRALYHSIDSAFEFEQLSTLPDRDTFIEEGLKLIADRSKEFFALVSLLSLHTQQLVPQHPASCHDS